MLKNGSRLLKKIKLMKRFLFLSIVFFVEAGSGLAQVNSSSTLHIMHCSDFAVTGNGSNAAWNATPWVTIPIRSQVPVHYNTQVKVLYSDSGREGRLSC